ncbi:MAG: fibronectin type III domain-containing protein, partial [Ruminiclostridium sp.]|nr:fibronectin type III domain-containing protein [Ruminiclostridium sp.]
GLSAGTKYQFRMKAYKTYTSSTFYSDYTAIGYLVTKPANITGFATKASGTNYITIGWDKNDSATGYIIEQYKNGAWTQIAKITSNATTSYNVTGLSAGTKYQFRMKAYKTYTSSTFYSDYVTVSDTTNS